MKLVIVQKHSFVVTADILLLVWTITKGTCADIQDSCFSVKYVMFNSIVGTIYKNTSWINMACWGVRFVSNETYLWFYTSLNLEWTEGCFWLQKPNSYLLWNSVENHQVSLVVLRLTSTPFPQGWRKVLFPFQIQPWEVVIWAGG